MGRHKEETPKLDIVGKKFGQRLVTKFSGWQIGPHPTRPDGKRASVWEYTCECGNIGTAALKNLRRNESCGCVRVEVNTERLTTHGGCGTREFSIYRQMVSRCHHEKNVRFSSYGGRGIWVCDRWRESFTNFLADMGQTPTANHSIERIDNDGPYSPENCRWAVVAEQNRNKRNNRLLIHNGETLCLKDWADQIGVPFGTLRKRLETHSVDDALTMQKGGARARSKFPIKDEPRRSGPTIWVKHGMEGTVEYTTWSSAKDRCYREKNPCFPNYGGRGIKMCDKWLHDFAAFLEDMGPRPSDEHSLDRIDSNGDYCPENCRWATRMEQGGNTRRVRLLTFDGRTQNMTAWAKEVGLSITTLCVRLKSGWAVERALTTPPRRKS